MRSRGCSISWLPRIGTHAAVSALDAPARDESLELGGPGLELRHALIVLELLDRLEELDDVLAVAVADLAAAVVASTSCWKAWWRYGGLASRTHERVASRMTSLVLAVGGRRGGSRSVASAPELGDRALEDREAIGDVRLECTLHKLNVLNIALDTLEGLVDLEDGVLEVRGERLEVRVEGVVLLGDGLLHEVLGVDVGGPLLEVGPDLGFREVLGEALLHVALYLVVGRLLKHLVHEVVVAGRQLGNLLVLRSELAIGPTLDLIWARPAAGHVGRHIRPWRAGIEMLWLLAVRLLRLP